MSDFMGEQRRMTKNRTVPFLDPLKEIIQTRQGKALIAIWGLIIMVIIGFATIGYLKDQLIGYLFLSFFPTAILANISIIIFYKTEKNGFQFVKTGWYLLCAAVIFFTLTITVIDPQKVDNYFAAGVFIIYPMIVLSFPSGFLVVYIYGGLSYLADYLGITSSLDFGKMNFYLTNFILWLGFFIVGYLQWFKLLPFLIGKWQSRRSHASPR